MVKVNFLNIIKSSKTAVNKVVSATYGDLSDVEIKPPLISDVFEKSIIKGKFGFQHINSKPLEELRTQFAKEIGQSTPPNNCGAYWLKSSIDVPLSTSGVHNCAACVIVDTKNNEHFLYHVMANSPAKSIADVIKKCIGKDFDKAFIIPGDQNGTEITSSNIIAAIKKLNKKSPVEFRHFSSERPEIVSYNSNVYAIPNNTKDLAQASFNVIENLDYTLI